MAESNLRRALIVADNSILEVMTKPITATLLTLGILTLVTSILRHRKHSNKIAAMEMLEKGK